jgi:hypothetical protein
MDMSKGQRGNKEAKKPKRAPAPVLPQVAEGVPAASTTALPGRLKK